MKCYFFVKYYLLPIVEIFSAIIWVNYQYDCNLALCQTTNFPIKLASTAVK